MTRARHRRYSAVVLLLVATLLARRLQVRWAPAGNGLGAVLLWAGLGAVVYALASVPGTIAHGALFRSTHTETPSMWQAGQQTILTCGTPSPFSWRSPW